MRKPLTLNQILQEVENLSSEDQPDEIYILPPENCNNDVTDEDSGEENNVDLYNLPGAQLLSEAVVNSAFDEEYDSEDDICLAQLAKRIKTTNRIVKASEPRKYIWEKRDIEPSLPIWKEVSGCKIELSPMEAFLLFFDDEIIELFVKYTNKYATDHNREGNVHGDEMRCFFGILLLSGYVIVPRREMYWESSPDVHHDLVASAMKRNRFRFIMQNIHCCDNENLQQNDKFAKLRPLFDIIGRNFIEFTQIEEHHCVDESMVPYYGNHGTKQFIRGKPIRWGYKIWMATNRLGYIEWFEPYQGKSTPLQESFRHLGLGASVVLQFADVLQARWQDIPFDIYFDNFFTSTKLLEELKSRNLKGTGTIRENRLGKAFPLQKGRELKTKSRGFYDYVSSSDNSIVVVKWVDNSIVTLASNNNVVFPTVTAKRYSQAEKIKIIVQQPNLIKKYNDNMGGVDRADQNMGLYRTSIRGKKWYFPLISHCLDMSVQNAWHIYRNSGGKLDGLAFRRHIATGLLETFKKPSSTAALRHGTTFHSHSRLDGRDHLIIYKERQTRCIECHKKANFSCSKCNVTLHPKDCFMLYHTKK